MPTFQNQKRSSGNILAIPNRKIGTIKQLDPIIRGSTKPFRSPKLDTSDLFLNGTTRDGIGNALPNCVLDLFVTRTDVKVASTTSDSSGNYSFQILVGGPFYIVAYLEGSPDIAGTTVNDLVGG